MSLQRIFSAAALCGALAVFGPNAANAQGFLRPPGSVPGGDPVIVPAQSQDAAGLLIRIDRLENQVRNLNGQIEQMQFQNRRLEEQLRKFQQDVEFRFQESGGKPAAQPRPQAQQPPQRRSEAEPAVGAPTTLAGPIPTQPAQTTGRPGRRGDAFDPDATPNAPGAPQRLGSIASSATALPPPTGIGEIIDEADEGLDGDGPLDLNPARRPALPPPRQTASVLPAPDAGAPASLPRVLPPLSQTPRAPTAPAGQALGAPNAQVASLPPAATGPRADYDAAMLAYKAGQYEDAQAGLQDFLKKYPKDRLVSEAVFYLGESYAKRSRHREAAEQYLKMSTDFGKTSRAPEAMVKLGMSLDKLGLKEQACATFGEVGRKYPNASPSLRTAADREFKRNQC